MVQIITGVLTIKRESDLLKYELFLGLTPNFSFVKLSQLINCTLIKKAVLINLNFVERFLPIPGPEEVSVVLEMLERWILLCLLLLTILMKYDNQV